MGSALTSCAIMQPHYLPWAGYFHLIASVDVFVLLDDVQYERYSWQCKNRILKGAKSETIEVPVRKQPLTELIANIEVDDAKPWRERHLTALKASYGHLPHGGMIVAEIEKVLGGMQGRLVDINSDLLAVLMAALGLTTRVIKASVLGCGGRRSEHVAEICKAVGADSYMSPAGAQEYLTEDQFEIASGIPITYMKFPSDPYPQGAGPFVSHLSIVDLIAHCGTEFAATYVARR
jgi:hypothetical protein